VSVAWSRHDGFYLPSRHPDSFGFSKEQLGAWLRDHAKAGCRFLFHNAHYDVGWIRAEYGLAPGGYTVEDTQCQAVILDENRLDYKLDSLCRDRGLPGKDDSGLKEALSVYGYPARGDTWKANLWRLPARYVAPYAAADATSTFGLWEEQNVEIEKLDTEARTSASNWLHRSDMERRGLADAYRLEMDLVPLVHEMRWRGVKVNVDRAAREAEELRKHRDTVLSDLGHRLGCHVGMEDIGRTRWKEEMFDGQGIKYPRTAATRNYPNGQASFTAGATGWMHKHDHWLPQMVVKAEKLHKASKDFLEGHILAYAHRGRIHACINQYKSEDGLGTKTHRFSYSDPALQQEPKRDEDLMERIRGCFEPEEGERWCACDYPQQEYRMIVNFAEVLGLPKAKEAGDRYRNDPDTDFHDMVCEMTNPRVDFSGMDKKSPEFKKLRKPAKDANFGKAFGAGVPKFAEMINLSLQEAQAIYDNYDKELPFVKALAEAAESAAARRGYVRLIDGARLHYESWEPRYRDWVKEQEYLAAHPKGRGVAPCTRDEGLARVNDKEHPWRGALRRAFTRKAGNGLIQGSAARQTKMAMVMAWREGIVPLLQVHDELDASVETEAAGLRLAEIMSTCVKLTVPINVKAEFGRNWGDAKHRWSEVK
jgi:DNA polymerase I-like protein with 3'-5' exonuclease and polymerase domains